MSDESPDPKVAGVIIAGRYRIERRIGTGGMGAVYQATPIEGGRSVAIKLLRSRYSHDYSYRRRFVREARVASSIVHRNVMRVFDYGQTKSGRVFLVMEYLAGEDLGQLLRRQGALCWSRTRPILQQVIAGLRAAHEQGVLHRDIKPSNVFLMKGRSGCPDFVRLLDFGLAKAVDPTSSLAESLTLPDEVMGTPQYLAPERLLGKPADSRSDLYSLGVMAFRMLTGELPPCCQDRDLQGLFQRTCCPPPSMLEHHAGIAPAVDALIGRVMAVDPEDRFATLCHFERAMMAIPIDDRPVVVARRHSSTQRYGEATPRNMDWARVLGTLPTLSVSLPRQYATMGRPS